MIGKVLAGVLVQVREFFRSFMAYLASVSGFEEPSASIEDCTRTSVGFICDVPGNRIPMGASAIVGEGGGDSGTDLDAQRSVTVLEGTVDAIVL